MRCFYYCLLEEWAIMHNNVIYWGRGSRAEEAKELFPEWNLVAVIDSDSRYQGTMWHGVEVISFQKYMHIECKPWILVTPDKPEEIIAVLKKNGVENYILLNDLLFPKGKNIVFETAEKSVWYAEKQSILLSCYYKNWWRERKLFYKAFFLMCFQGSTLSVENNLLGRIKKAKFPVVNTEHGRKIMEIITGRSVNVVRYAELPSETDLLIFPRPRIDYLVERLAVTAIERRIPMIFCEEGFLNSIEPFMGTSAPIFQFRHSIIFDEGGLYLNALVPSRIENILNSDWQLSEHEFIRTRELISIIKKEKLSKYNCQPIGKKIHCRQGQRVLVIDQVYGDKSIEFGLADDEKSFKKMLKTAIEENRNADIFIKAHPVVSKGHFADIEEKEKIHILTDAINPIELLQQMDKVYVVSSQMGFEAAFCGCEVHCFGMPFYAGWGITLDYVNCLRRKKRRTIEEVFYVAYVMATTYVSHKKNAVCEIEDVVEELIELRDEYNRSE